jgi:hypothetical protein
MRGAFGSGVQAAFDRRNPHGRVRRVVGSSAAAFNFMYWCRASRISELAFYAEELPNPRDRPSSSSAARWISCANFCGGEPVMNLLAVADAMENRKPIRKDRVRNHP